MKKIITLLALVLLLSCSKDGDSTLPLSYQNLAGNWNYKSIIRTDGTIVPYVRICSTKANWVEIFPSSKIITYNYNSNCVDSYNYGTSYYTFDAATNRIYAPFGFFDETIVKNLTRTSFILEFKEPEDLSFYGQNVTDAKAYIFERQQD